MVSEKEKKKLKSKINMSLPNTTITYLELTMKMPFEYT